jgi:hypothetical protein
MDDIQNYDSYNTEDVVYQSLYITRILYIILYRY